MLYSLSLLGVVSCDGGDERLCSISIDTDDMDQTPKECFYGAWCQMMSRPFIPGFGDFLWRKTLSVSPSASFWCGADHIAKDQVFFAFRDAGSLELFCN